MALQMDDPHTGDITERRVLPGARTGRITQPGLHVVELRAQMDGGAVVPVATVRRAPRLLIRTRQHRLERLIQSDIGVRELLEAAVDVSRALGEAVWQAEGGKSRADLVHLADEAPRLGDRSDRAVGAGPQTRLGAIPLGEQRVLDAKSSGAGTDRQEQCGGALRPRGVTHL